MRRAAREVVPAGRRSERVSLNSFATTRLLQAALVVAVLAVPALVTWSVLSRGDGPGAAPPAPRPARTGFAAYAASDSCRTCHQKAHDAHVLTPHFITSAPADGQNVKGSFEPGKNLVRLDGDLAVRMTERDGRLVQEAVVGGAARSAFPFDVVIGSGKRGQSFLHWDGDALCQLPASYLTSTGGWVNSPGFPRHELQVDRPILPECLQCHSTYFEKRSRATLNEYVRGRAIFGIDCQRCHGPAADHVAFHTAHPQEKEPKHVVRIKALGRQQRLDVCAQCHSGVRESSRPPFAFRPGDSIAEATLLEYQPEDVKQIDVHSNQYGLLAGSACFKASGTMTCTTCHDPHALQRGALAHSANCLTCHKSAESCKLSRRVPAAELSNCVDCHMPELPSRNLLVQNAEGGGQEPLKFRTHLIGVYQDKTAELLEFMRKAKEQ